MSTKNRSVQIAVAMFVVVVFAVHTNKGAAATLIVSDEFDLSDYGNPAPPRNVLAVNPAGGTSGPGSSWGTQWQLPFVGPGGGTAVLVPDEGHGDFLAVSTTGFGAAPGGIQVARSIDVGLPDFTSTCFLVDVCLKSDLPDEYEFRVDFKGTGADADLAFSLKNGEFLQTLGGTTQAVNGFAAESDKFYTIAGRIDFDEFGDETFSLWIFEEGVNAFPGFDSLGPADGVIQDELGTAKIDRFGIFADSPSGDLVGGGVYSVLVEGKTPGGNGAVPEPSTAMLAGLGLVAVGVFGRRRRRNQASM